jgi:D-aminoacyl-tRNA deacylase
VLRAGFLLSSVYLWIDQAMATSYLVVASEADPVASRLVERWGVSDSTGWFIDGAPIRRLGPDALLLRRPGLHIHDEGLDLRLPVQLRNPPITMVFPSIHRSEQGVECLTVHPLGNPGEAAEVGGRARTLTPTDPRRMAATLRRLSEMGESFGLSATYEATHHGPELAHPAFFVEIGYGTAAVPTEEAIEVLASTIPEILPDSRDLIALAVGGGHYAPHFTYLALRRHWAFGHILSRHALTGLDAPTARSAFDRTPGSEGILFARAEDATNPVFSGLGPRLRDGQAPPRDARGGTTGASLSPTASGT